MRNIFTIALFFMAMNFTFAQSKSHTDNFAIPNGDLENWYNIVLNPSVSWDDPGTGPTDNWLGTLNSLAAVPPTAGGPGPVTIFKTTDSQHGTYAAMAVSAEFPLGPVTIFIPGMLGTAIMDNVNVRAIMGRPCADCKPSKLKGFYKFEPVNGDSCTALVLLSRWNSTTKQRDTVGYGKMVQREAVSAYTEFEVPVVYRESGSVDSITLLIISSAGFNVVNFMGSVGQVGSKMYIDNLSLDYASGFQQVLMPEIGVTAYPNPAKDVLNLDLSKELKNGVVEIMDGSGKLAGTFAVTQKNNAVPVSGLANGSYYFRLLSGRELVNSGTFIISR